MYLFVLGVRESGKECSPLVKSVALSQTAGVQTPVLALCDLEQVSDRLCASGCPSVSRNSLRTCAQGGLEENMRWYPPIFRPAPGRRVRCCPVSYSPSSQDGAPPPLLAPQFRTATALPRASAHTSPPSTLALCLWHVATRLSKNKSLNTFPTAVAVASVAASRPQWCLSGLPLRGASSRLPVAAVRRHQPPYPPQHKEFVVTSVRCGVKGTEMCTDPSCRDPAVQTQNFHKQHPV